MTRRPSTASRPGRRHQSGASVGGASSSNGRDWADMVPSVAEPTAATSARIRPHRSDHGRGDTWIAGSARPAWQRRSAPSPSEARPDAPARRFRLRGPLDLAATLAPLRHGSQDPTIRIRGRSEVLRATLTPEGPTTEYLRHLGDEVEVEAWGPGAGWARRARPRPGRRARRPVRLPAPARRPGRLGPAAGRRPTGAFGGRLRGPGAGRPGAEDHRPRGGPRAAADGPGPGTSRRPDRRSA